VGKHYINPQCFVRKATVLSPHRLAILAYWPAFRSGSITIYFSNIKKNKEYRESFKCLESGGQATPKSIGSDILGLAAEPKVIGSCWAVRPNSDRSSRDQMERY